MSYLTKLIEDRLEDIQEAMECVHSDLMVLEDRRTHDRNRLTELEAELTYLQRNLVALKSEEYKL